MPHHPSRLEDLFLTRRDLLRRGGMGMAALGLAGLQENPTPAVASGRDCDIEVPEITPEEEARIEAEMKAGKFFTIDQVRAHLEKV